MKILEKFIRRIRILISIIRMFNIKSNSNNQRQIFRMYSPSKVRRKFLLFLIFFIHIYFFIYITIKGNQNKQRDVFCEYNLGKKDYFCNIPSYNIYIKLFYFGFLLYIVILSFTISLGQNLIRDLIPSKKFKLQDSIVQQMPLINELNLFMDWTMRKTSLNFNDFMVFKKLQVTFTKDHKNFWDKTKLK